MEIKPFARTFLTLIIGGALLAASGAQAKSRVSQARRWRIIVIVPERHLSRPRIPDPAAETMISKRLIDAGYKVVDQDRIKDLRYSAVVDRIIKGGPSAVKEAMQIGRKFGADILITGEAFSQEVARQVQETEVGTVNVIRCRARVELKGIRMDTGEKIYADAIQKTGGGEFTEELSSKASLEAAAEEVTDSLLDKLGKLAFSDSQYVELEVRGISSAAKAEQLEMALAKLPGVLDVQDGDYDARVYATELQIKKTALRGFAARLETAPSLKRFRLISQSANGSKIILNCK